MTGRDSYILILVGTFISSIIIIAGIFSFADSVRIKEIISRDGAPMVLIPAGDFQMGYGPYHTVYLDAFYIDRYEVTNAQYLQFVEATGHREPMGTALFNGWRKDFRPWSDERFNGYDQPVVCVSWDDAKAYCDWVGKRLPTNAEWEKAARGGLNYMDYPWGNILTHDFANYGGIGLKDEWKYTAPVGSFEPNGYGLYDMAGNVWEWVADYWGRGGRDRYANPQRWNPRGIDTVSSRLMRGGSWFYYNESIRVTSALNSKSTSLGGLISGFRCAKDIKR